ncbi:MAG TPA: peptide chain release factor N(5)-glutamine methyltransferase [Rhodospirillales bacterium]|nr:peptide chain release factor N(5)-glutamine methyltransferase [Rhodospirillales bacterium]
MTSGPTLGAAYRDASRRLADAGIGSARLDARIMVSFALGGPPTLALTEPDRHLSGPESARLADLLKRRERREPLAHIVEAKEFWSLPFRVGPDALVPRPDSETLIEAVLKYFPDREKSYAILDFGTGSGCLLLALLSEYGASRGTGVDISDKALSMAKENAESLSLADRASFVRSDWGDENVEEHYDIIVSNPPYIPDAHIEGLAPEVAAFEPRLALSGGADGLVCYRALAPRLSSRLAKGGLAFLEIGEGMADDVSSLFRKHGLKTLESIEDLSGIERCLVLEREE